MVRIKDRAAIEGDGAGLDQRLEARAREFGDMAGEQAVEALAGLLVRDDD